MNEPNGMHTIGITWCVIGQRARIAYTIIRPKQPAASGLFSLLLVVIYGTSKVVRPETGKTMVVNQVIQRA